MYFSVAAVRRVGVSTTVNTDSKHSAATHIMPFFIFFASNDRNLDVQISCSVHGCSKLPKNMTALVFLVSNSVKLTHKSKKSCNFCVFGLKKYENRKLCVSYVALHKKHVCNLCTHEKTCV